MNIVFLARYLPQEGSTTHMYTLSEEMVRRGHSVSIISAGPKSDVSAITIYEQNRHIGVDHIKIGFPLNPSFTLIGKVVQLFKYILVIPRFNSLIRKIKPDVIHVHYPVTSYLPYMYNKFHRKKIKFVSTYHIIGIPKHLLHKKADYAIAISSELKNDLIKRLHYDSMHVVTIFNGVSANRFGKPIEERNQLIQKFALPSDKILIGFVGSLVFRKGIDVLLKSVADLDKEVYHVILLGDGDNDWVNQLINDNQIKNNVSVFPFQDPITFYSIFDIFVLPSRKEGFGLVSIEAMMMGVATIRSDVEGAKDQISHGKDGLLFKNEDVLELRSCLSRLINDERGREEIAKNGKEKALRNFTEEIMVDKTLSLYQRILD
jgi:glycosyltransferase involved in cell wall biosynthesis